MLTAWGTTPDKVKGLDVGADDYLTKPLATEELLARVRARLRRAPAVMRSNNKLFSLGIPIDFDTRQVVRDGQNVSLTKLEFDLLAFLAENTGILLSREAILNRVWGYGYYGDTNIVDVYIRYLRTKIGAHSPQDCDGARRRLHLERGRLECAQ